MHKFFKTYINLLSAIGLIIIGYFFVNISSVQLDIELWELLIIGSMTIISAFFVMNYAEDKTLSFYSTFIIFATFFIPTVYLFGVVLFGDVVYKIKLVYIDKEHDKLFDVKLIFNYAVKVIIVGVLHFIRLYVMSDVAYIVVSGIVYNVINVYTITWVIRLYNNDFSLKVLDFRKNLKEVYYIIVTTLLLLLGYNASGYLGAVFVFVFLMSFLGYILTPVTHQSMLDQIQKDSLTGLKSRGVLDKILFDKIYERHPFTLVFIDFDRFKRINDTYGHHIGDQVLKDFANKAFESFYLSDKLYRFGGDEFCLIVDGDDDLELALYSLRSMYSKNAYTEGELVIEYGVTLGVYNYNGENLNVSDVISEVSKNMKLNKSVMK